MTEARQIAGRRVFSPLEFLRSIVQARLRPTSKLIAYTLLGLANGQTGEVRARQRVIAEYAGVRPRTIRSALRDLERAAMVTTTYRKGPGMRTNLAIYTLKAVASTCRTPSDEAAAPDCRCPPEAAAPSDRRQRYPDAAHSDSGNLIAPEAQSGGAQEIRKPGSSEAVWSIGVTILTGAGRTESSARSLLGKWIREHGEEAVAGALGIAATRADPASYVVGVLNRRRRREASVELIPLIGEEFRLQRRTQA